MLRRIVTGKKFTGLEAFRVCFGIKEDFSLEKFAMGEFSIG